MGRIVLPVSDGQGNRTDALFHVTAGLPELAPGELTQAALDGAGPGATLRLGDGLHRLTAGLVPQAGQHIVAARSRQAIVTGANLYAASDFTLSGGLWKIGGQFQRGTRYTVPQGIGTALGYPEQVFYDDMPLRRVASKVELGPGEWWHDFALGEIWVHDNPSGHKVEIGNGATHAFSNSVADVVLEGLVVEKFNTPAGGGVAVPLGVRWRGTDLEVRWNYGSGTWSGDDSILEYSRVHHQAYAGLYGHGSRTLIDHVEVDGNAYGGFNVAWESSGSKFVTTDGLHVRDSRWHHNSGAGFWADIDNINTVLERVECDHNSLSGIVLEIGYKATLVDCHSHDNGQAAVFVSTNRDVEIAGGMFTGPGGGPGLLNGGAIAGWQEVRGGPRAHGPYETANLHVHDTTMDVPIGTACTGLEGIGNQAPYFTATKQVRWVRNHYLFPRSRQAYEWNDRVPLLSGEQWAAGSHTYIPMDADGTWAA